MKSNLITHTHVHRVCSMIGHESGRLYVDEPEKDTDVAAAEARARRDAEIATRHDAGEMFKELAFACRLNASRIWQICREQRG